VLIAGVGQAHINVMVLKRNLAPAIVRAVLQVDEHVPLKEAINKAHDGKAPLYVAFPGQNAVNLEAVLPDQVHRTPAAATAQQPRYTLILLDGTWQYAKEMCACLPCELLGPGGAAKQVQLLLATAPAAAAQPPAAEQRDAAAAGAPAAQLLTSTHLPLRTEPLVRTKRLFCRS
jgi:DTW domain